DGRKENKQLFNRDVLAHLLPLSTQTLDALGGLKLVPRSASEPRRGAGTVSRDGLWRAQTPPAFRRDVLERARAHADATGFDGTDDASLCEHAGIPVVVVPGDRRNLKITTPDDLVLAAALAKLEDQP
ncbi:MAG: IspD/TarI family cytidylyltransferase, partial [Planctomycetota bacterium]